MLHNFRMKRCFTASSVVICRGCLLGWFSLEVAMMDSVNLCTLIEQFGSETRCRAYLEALRWPDTIMCPRCDSDKISKIVKREQYDCELAATSSRSPLEPSSTIPTCLVEVVPVRLSSLRVSQGHERESTQAYSRHLLQDGMVSLPSYPRCHEARSILSLWMAS